MERKHLTLGSLFDGAGGFPLGGLHYDISPLWASEIEPFPIRVTTTRMPRMKHYGDINNIDGEKLPPVDIITFGSPCQDMSIAGERNGLNGSRSSLFFEAIRVIKEMRSNTNGKYPRFIVWENVAGAFSSSNGEDFRTVLEQICKVKNSNISIPKPKKWSKRGEIVGDNFSLAWRQLDAQYWGVPQRRKRIYLVADFNGECASDILFKSEGLSRYSPEKFKEWETTSENIKNGVGETKCYGIDGYNFTIDKISSTLGVNCGMSTGRNGLMIINDQGGQKMNISDSIVSTLRAEAHHPPLVFADNTPNNESNAAYSASKTSIFANVETELASTLVATDYKDPPIVGKVQESDCLIRRLTPTECARLQGFPDWWCSKLQTYEPTDEEIQRWKNIFTEHAKAIGKNIKPKTDNQIKKWLQNPYSDTAAYKMWGNSVALPNVCFVLAGIEYLVNKEK